MRQPVLLFILKGEMDCTETADRRLGNSVQLTLTGRVTHLVLCQEPCEFLIDCEPSGAVWFGLIRMASCSRSRKAVF
jgi:hypothetical protein